MIFKYLIKSERIEIEYGESDFVEGQVGFVTRETAHDDYTQIQNDFNELHFLMSLRLVNRPFKSFVDRAPYLQDWYRHLSFVHSATFSFHLHSLSKNEWSLGMDIELGNEYYRDITPTEADTFPKEIVDALVLPKPFCFDSIVVASYGIKTWVDTFIQRLVSMARKRKTIYCKNICFDAFQDLDWDWNRGGKAKPKMERDIRRICHLLKLMSNDGDIKINEPVHCQICDNIEFDRFRWAEDCVSCCCCEASIHLRCRDCAEGSPCACFPEYCYAEKDWPNEECGQFLCKECIDEHRCEECDEAYRPGCPNEGHQHECLYSSESSNG